MYEDAYSMYYENRAFGQATPHGYSEKGRFPFVTPWAFQYFDNRAVGQSTMPVKKDKFFGIFNVDRNRTFTNGYITPKEPMNNPTNPTTVYGSGFAMPTFLTKKVNVPIAGAVSVGVILIAGVIAVLLLKKKKILKE